MKFLVFMALLAAPFIANATVKFDGTWPVGDGADVTVKTIGMGTLVRGEKMVTLSFEDGRRLFFIGDDLPMGLSLTGFQGKCIRVIPGLRWESVSLILSCD